MTTDRISCLPPKTKKNRVRLTQPQHQGVMALGLRKKIQTSDHVQDPVKIDACSFH